MAVSRKFLFNTIATLVGITTIAFSWSCTSQHKEVEDQSVTFNLPSRGNSQTRDVDLLFVIDNSLSMTENQTLLKSQFSELMRVLKEISGGLPDVHIGVVSTDLGSLPYNIPSCSTPGGDNGRLRTGETDSCVNPIGQSFIVDVEPAGCNIEHNADNDIMCDSNECTQANCDVNAFTDSEGHAKEPAGLTLQTDENGCPRCRNYTNETINEVFSCTADLGIHGCGFEQHLESMYKSFIGNNTQNTGFYRDDAYFTVFFLSDEDDCSVKENALFNPDGGVQDTLGPLTSFRCTEFGIKCDQEWQRVMPSGTAQYTGCAARTGDDPRAMLFPVSKYIDFLLQFKDSNKIIAGAIAGPYDNSLTVGVDDHENPELIPVCGQAVSGIRLKEFVQAFNPNPEDMFWAFTSVCSNDYTPALIGLGNKIRSIVEGIPPCPPKPLMGCPDPKYAFDESFGRITKLSKTEAGICEPLCDVRDVLPNMVEEKIEICADSYMDGHPLARDVNLPVDKCYHVIYDEKCDVGEDHSPSRGAEFIISRKYAPQAGTSTKITCQELPLTEKNCADNIDNDQDGCIDNDDTDCNPSGVCNEPD